MKKAIIIIAAVLALLVLVYVLGTGFGVNSSVYLSAYEMEGNELTVTVGCVSSVGYIRAAKTDCTDPQVLRIKFISAFGGINGSIGAKDTYTFAVNDSVERVEFLTGAGYTVVLVKTDGVWQRVE